MRFLQRTTNGRFDLTHDYLTNIPCYAILSHTWGNPTDEVVFDDVANLNLNAGKAGYKKLQFCAKQARQDGLQYFWVDTCCINKANHAELAEAITSMFRWYRNATKCYVYLSDVPAEDWELKFRKSRWFTRGWTLQELLAPRSVEFFSSDGQYLGDKRTLEQLIHEITAIPLLAIRGKKDLHEYSVNERFGWASKRKTTRKEDGAYCLQGIFNIFIPLIYGEEDHAWVRLRRAIAESQHPDFSQTPLVARAHDEDDNRIQQTLAFAEMHDRRLKVEPRHENTCEWILNDPDFQQWSSSQQGLLWIKGKPGAGKSTVMAFLFDELLKQTAIPMVKVDCFLNARGVELQRTFLGLLRSLVSQLFFQDPATREQVRRLYQTKVAASGKIKMSWEWQHTELETIFSHNVIILAQRQPVTVFVDALDEAGETMARRIAEYFHRLNEIAASKQAQLKICISCRHYPIVTSRVSKFEIVVEDHNTNDIASYVNDKLYLEHVLVDDPSNDWQSLKNELAERAQGVFQWAYLVTPLVQKYVDNGDSPQDVRIKLQYVPAELKTVYTYILQTIIDEVDREPALRLFRWVCLASHPLTVTELRYAMAVRENDMQLFNSYNTNWIDSDDRMKRRMRSLSGGLLEIVSRPTYEEKVVQVGHQSITDFMLAEGLALLYAWTGQHEVSLLPPSDLMDDIPALTLVKQEYNVLRHPRDTFKTYPFLDYALNNLFLHADKAKSQRSQDLPQEIAALEQLIPPMTALQYKLYQPNTWSITWFSQLLHVVALNNIVDIAQYLVENVDDLNCRDIDKRTPLHLALKQGNQEIAECLIEAGADINVIDDHDQTPLLYAIQKLSFPLVEMLIDRGALTSPITNGSRDALVAAAAYGQAELVTMLLNRGAQVNVSDRYYGTALNAAVLGGRENVVRILIDHGANLSNPQGAYDQPFPLHNAAFKGFCRIVELLIARGAPVNFSNSKGSALCAAAAKGHTDVVKSLLAYGADANLPERGVFPSPLFAAVKSGHDEIVKLLLQAGAYVNTDTQGGLISSPLVVAAGWGTEESVHLLINAGADINAIGPQGNSLEISARHGRVGVVKALLEAGVDINSLNTQSNKALYWAKLRNHHDIVQMLQNAIIANEKK